MSWPYTSCGNVQVNKDAVFAALLLVYDPHHPHPCCSRNKHTIIALDKSDTTPLRIKFLWLSSSSWKWGLAIVSSHVPTARVPDYLFNPRTPGAARACGWKNPIFPILVLEGCY